ncbi:MAG: histidine kinase [Muribaculaceae bacterium]|nr:histidine kinase [Muribaculaceae bacterium]
MKKKGKYLKYAVGGMCALLLSTGPICMAYLFATEEPGGKIFWLIIPFMALMTLELWLPLKIYIPRLLDKGRFVAFGISVMLTAYFVNLGAVVVDYWMRDWLELPIIVKHPLSVWVWVEGIAACIVGLFLICGMSLWLVYERSEQQNEKEREIKRLLEEKTRLFKEGIRMGEVRDMLDDAITTMERNPGATNKKIQRLSDFLRKRLYDEDGKFTPGEKVRQEEREKNSFATDFLIARRYRGARHVCLIGVFLIMSTGLFFGEPDKPDFSTGSLVYAGVFFLILTGLTYLNMFVVFPFFQKRGKVMLYGWSLFIVLTLIGIVMCAGVMKPEGVYNDYGVRVPDFIFPISMAGNMLTFFFIFAGSASIMLLKGNLEGKWRTAHEEAEVARVEFEILQQQINPHFLFNVLNNAGILSYDDPAEGAATLRGLKSFLEYMIKESGRKWTTAGMELAFISDYLTMEKSSGKALEVEEVVEEGAEDFRLPPLLLIPFVENAVKHSRGVDRDRRIMIKMRMEENKLRFVCLNTCPDTGEAKGGGLGIANTRRRLFFLYGEDYRLTAWRRGGEYRVELIIPEKI